MIDVSSPIATPFRAQWSVEPRTDFEFRTGIITSADGTEQRTPKNRYPSAKIRFTCMARDRAHAQRITDMMPLMTTSALAIRDFRMGGEGVVSTNGASVQLFRWSASWAVGVRVILEDEWGLHEHTAIITGADPVSRTLSLGAPAPSGLRGSHVGVASALVCSLDGDLASEFKHSGAVSWDVAATSFRGIDPIGGAPLSAFPFTHGSPDAMRITASRNVLGLDFGVGRRAEVLGYASATSGFRTFQVEARQMSQQSKEAVVSFFGGCRGRLRSFAAPDLVPDVKFRLGSDILSIAHRSGDVSSATLNLVQVLR